MRKFAVILLVCSALAAEDKFPAHWFAPVPADEAQWWEILPQEAAPGEVILSKRHELGTFSNLSPAPFYYHGKRYASVEGFWYSLAYPEGPDDSRSKAPGITWKFTRDQISQMTMFDAKDAGGLAEANMAAMGINWVTFEGRRMKYMDKEKGEHYQLITKVIWEKVRQNPKVKELLLSTGDLILKPDNFDSLRDLPAWRYFDIYMDIRATLRSGAALPPTERYPAHWWTPVSEVNKPDWEILAQAAKPGEVILSKRHELGILSNFGPTPFTLYGRRYASVEGFWQMMLYPEGPSEGSNDPRAKAPGIKWAHTRDEVAAMTGFEAKDAGSLAYDNMKKMGIDWVTFDGKKMTYWSKERGEHYRLIMEAMRAKLAQNPKVADILLSTGDLILLPDHYQEEDPPAEWLYFKIWMDLRSELQAAGK